MRLPLHSGRGFRFGVLLLLTPVRSTFAFHFSISNLPDNWF